MITNKKPYIVDPSHMEFIEWARALISAMNGILPAYNAQDDSEWKHWAATVAEYPQLVAFNLPSPYLYKQWKPWAEAMITTLSTAGV